MKTSRPTGLNMESHFLPFEDVEAAKDIGELLESLDLSKARSALLWQLLRRFEIQVWFGDGKDGDNPRLEIVTFWDMNHVASMPLTTLLEHVVAFRSDAQEIGGEEEIVALSELKTLIDKAIASRLQQNEAAE
jgi:hypothetical protein